MSSGTGTDLRPEDEAAAYERLKPRLAALWKEVFPHDDEAYTSVIVPSVTVDALTLERHSEAIYYEEALLFLLIRLRNPRSRVVYVTSRPLPQAVLDYYLQFLAGIPVSHAAARLTLLSAYDSSPRPLTEKILERPRLVEKIKSRIVNFDRAY
ncbi:MAG TPA: carboxylate-amine ligase, partial [Vicinamibacteria bacterium]